MVPPPNSPEPGLEPLFDRIIVVDWSAHTGPKRGADSIWLCSLDAATLDTPDTPDIPDIEVLENIPTRLEARSRLRELMAPRHADGASRTLLSIDVALGYPAGTAHGAGLVAGHDDRPWESMWRHLATTYQEGERNRPSRDHDRWSVASDLNRRLVASGHGLRFWGCPPRRANEHLTTTKPPDARTAADRECEARLRTAGLRPFPVWQLLGAGSVGSQTLTAIPMLEALRHEPDLAGRVVVWPFETGIDQAKVSSTLADASVVIAEIWPGTLTSATVDACIPVHSPDVKDARQVTALARHLRTLDRNAQLLAHFCPELDEATATRVVDEEGWILLLPTVDGNR